MKRIEDTNKAVIAVIIQRRTDV